MLYSWKMLIVYYFQKTKKKLLFQGYKIINVYAWKYFGIFNISVLVINHIKICFFYFIF